MAAARFEQPDPLAGRDPVRAADLAELMRWVRRLAAAVGPQSVQDDTGTHTRARLAAAPFWARITARDPVSGQYAWVEQRFNPLSGAMEDRPGGRSGNGGGEHAAVSVNPAAVVPVDARVLLHRAPQTHAYLFHFNVSGQELPIGCSDGYKTVHVVTAVTCNGDGTISVTTEPICVRDV